MDLTPVWVKDTNIITKYRFNGIYINDNFYSSNILLGEKFIHNWEIHESLNNLSNYSIIKDLQTQYWHINQEIILILGTGQKLIIPDSQLVNKLSQTNIRIEFMLSPSACRLYNILIAEQRAVIAALILD